MCDGVITDKVRSPPHLPTVHSLPQMALYTMSWQDSIWAEFAWTGGYQSVAAVSTLNRSMLFRILEKGRVLFHDRAICRRCMRYRYVSFRSHCAHAWCQRRLLCCQVPRTHVAGAFNDENFFGRYGNDVPVSAYGWNAFSPRARLSFTLLCWRTRPYFAAADSITANQVWLHGTIPSKWLMWTEEASEDESRASSSGDWPL